MSTPLVVVINQSTTISDIDLAACIEALRTQVDDHLGPAWEVGVRLSSAKQGEPTPPGCWKLVLAEEVDEPGALGYHTDEEGVPPAGVIGVRTALADGVSWQSVLSHELCEMLVDPWATLAYQVGDRMLALEVCDPVEGAPYQINGVQMENFVLPSWFDPEARGPYDFMGVLHAPLTLAHGGYSQSVSIGAWEQQNAKEIRQSKRMAAPGSRRFRRVHR